MRALVFYESIDGNTSDVANAIAAGLCQHLIVAVVEVGFSPVVVPEAVDLLVAGGPTHAFGLSTAANRATQHGDVLGGAISRFSELPDWLRFVVLPCPGAATAACDTRITWRRLPGSAAVAIDRRLSRLVAHPISAPESFELAGKRGPVKPDELDRAERWGQRLARLVIDDHPAAAA